MSSLNSVKANPEKLIANNSQQHNNHCQPLPPREEAIQNWVTNIFKMMAYGKDYIHSLEPIQDQGSFVLQFVPIGYLNSEKTPLFNNYLRAVESTIKQYDTLGYIKTEICEEEKNKTQYTILKLRVNPEYKNLSVNEINLIFISIPKEKLESSLNENINSEVKKDPFFKGKNPHLAIKALHRIEQGISNVLNTLRFPLNIERKILQNGTTMGITYCLSPLNNLVNRSRARTRIECAIHAMEATFRDKLDLGKATYTVQKNDTFSIDITSNLIGFKSETFEEEFNHYFYDAYRYYFEKMTGKNLSIPAVESPSNDIHDAVDNKKLKREIDVFIKDNIREPEKEEKSIQNVFDQILIDANYVCAISKEMLHDACFVEEKSNEQNKMTCIHYFNSNELEQWLKTERDKNPYARMIKHPVTGVLSIKANGSNIKKSPQKNKEVAQYLGNVEQFLQKAHSQQISSESNIKKYLEEHKIKKCLEKPLIWLSSKVTTLLTVEVGKVVGANIGEAIAGGIGSAIGKEIGSQVGKALGPGLGGVVGNRLVSTVSSGIGRFSSEFFASPAINCDELPKPEKPEPKEEIVSANNSLNKVDDQKIFNQWKGRHVIYVRCVILDPWNYKSNSLNSVVNDKMWQGAFRAAIQFGNYLAIQNGPFITMKSMFNDETSQCDYKILHQQDICMLCPQPKKESGLDHTDDMKEMWNLPIDEDRVNDFSIKVIEYCQKKKYNGGDLQEYKESLRTLSKGMNTITKPSYEFEGEEITFNNHEDLDTFMTENSFLITTFPLDWAKLIAYDRIFNLDNPLASCPHKPDITLSLPMPI